MSGADGSEKRVLRNPGDEVSGNSLSWPSPRPLSVTLSHLGRYRIVREIASGGMAKVYLAVVDGLHKLVALKVIHPNLAQERPFVGMFLDEARIASSICHRNVCSVFDFGECEGYYYIAMEYLAGQTLRDVNLRLRAFGSDSLPSDPAGYIAYVIAEASEGLHAAHETLGLDERPLEVVHRDVSPHNLFVTYDGNVSVVDFGIARAANRLQHTATGVLKGKFSYMAPEQIRQEHVDRRADIWSLGVCLWEGLTQRRLFKRPTPADTLMGVLVDPIPPPSQVNIRLPAELDAIVMRALERRVDERYATARELGRDLLAFSRRSSLAVGPLELELWMSELFADDITRKKRLVSMALQRSGEETIHDGTSSGMPRSATHSGARIKETAQALLVGASHAPYHPFDALPGPSDAAPSSFDPVPNPLEARPTGASRRSVSARFDSSMQLGLLLAVLVAFGIGLGWVLAPGAPEATAAKAGNALKEPSSTAGQAPGSLVATGPRGSEQVQYAGAGARERPSAPRPVSITRGRVEARGAARAQNAVVIPSPEGTDTPGISTLPARGPTRFDEPRTEHSRGPRSRAEGATSTATASHDIAANSALAESATTSLAAEGEADSETAISTSAQGMQDSVVPVRVVHREAAHAVERSSQPRVSAVPAPAPRGVLGAEPRISDLKVEGSLGSGVIMRMLSRVTPHVRDCYGTAARASG